MGTHGAIVPLFQIGLPCLLQRPRVRHCITAGKTATRKSPTQSYAAVLCVGQ